MNRKKVLVIDDEDFIRELVKDFLELESVQCDEAEDAAQAIGLIPENRYDLILLDRNLGTTNAERVIDDIKEVSGETPIVILTGGPQYNDDYARSIGADGVILKPFQVDSFMEKIGCFLET